MSYVFCFGCEVRKVFRTNNTMNIYFLYGLYSYAPLSCMFTPIYLALSMVPHCVCYHPTVLHASICGACVDLFGVLVNNNFKTSISSFKLIVNSFDMYCHIGGAVCLRCQYTETYFLFNYENEYPICFYIECSHCDSKYRTPTLLYHFQDMDVENASTLTSTIGRARDPRTGATPVSGIETTIQSPPDLRPPSLDGLTPTPIDGSTAVYLESYVMYLLQIQCLHTHHMDELSLYDQYFVNEQCNQVYNDALCVTTCTAKSRMFMLYVYDPLWSYLIDSIAILKPHETLKNESNNVFNITMVITGAGYFNFSIENALTTDNTAPYYNMSGLYADLCLIYLPLYNKNSVCLSVDFNITSYCMRLYYITSGKSSLCNSRWFRMDTQSYTYGIHDPAVRHPVIVHNTQPTNMNIYELLRLATYSTLLRCRVQRIVCISVRRRTRPQCVELPEQFINVGIVHRTFNVFWVCNTILYGRHTKGCHSLRCIPIFNFEFTCKAQIWVDMGINHINVNLCFCLFKEHHTDLIQYERVYNTMYLQLQRS